MEDSTLGWRWGLWQIYCRVGIGWRWWAAEVCQHCVLSLPARVSPPHRCFTSLSFASIYESRVRSSQVLPFRCTTALLGILKDDSWKRISYTKSVLVFFFLLNYEEFMIAIWSGVSALLFCMFQIWCTTRASVSLGSWQGAEHAVRCCAPPNHSFDSSKKNMMTQIHIWHSNNKTT